jgi:hypothetical protein
MPQVACLFTEECQEDREGQDDELFILFDRQPQGELSGIRQAEEAGEDETNREWKLNWQFPKSRTTSVQTQRLWDSLPPSIKTPFAL